MSQKKIKLPYIIYNKDGKQISYNKMIKKLSKSDIVFFGEYHNNSISHWLELNVAIDLHKIKKINIGMEMFERDNNDSLQKHINDKDIEKIEKDSTIRLWPNYATDYKPIIDFAQNNNIDVFATNIPRRFANKVYKGDFTSLDTLSNVEKAWIAPLPIPFDSELKTYKEIINMMGGHGNPNMVKAQAIKDATMAYFILKHCNKDKIFIHINGSYHSDLYEGINWYIDKYDTNNLKKETITTVTQKDISKLEKENIGKADFIICVDETMTNTH